MVCAVESERGGLKRCWLMLEVGAEQGEVGGTPGHVGTKLIGCGHTSGSS